MARLGGLVRRPGVLVTRVVPARRPVVLGAQVPVDQAARARAVQTQVVLVRVDRVQAVRAVWRPVLRVQAVPAGLGQVVPA